MSSLVIKISKSIDADDFLCEYLLFQVSEHTNAQTIFFHLGVSEINNPLHADFLEDYIGRISNGKHSKLVHAEPEIELEPQTHPYQDQASTELHEPVFAERHLNYNL